jgi:hypothetical protein
LRGHLSTLGPLERLVEEFVTTTVACSVCHAPTGCNGDGPACRPRRSAALERYITGSTGARTDESVLR